MPPVPPGTKAIDLTYAAARIADRVTGSQFGALLTRRFGPGVPLAPTTDAQDRDGPRQWQYPVAWNTNIGQPRREQPGLTPFEQLRALATSYDVASICIATVTTIVSNLDFQIVAKDSKQQAAENATCDHLLQFFQRPDKVNDFSAWLGMLVYEMLTTDATTVFPRQSQGGGLWGLELVDGATIKPMLDARGQTAAYQQILYGTPWSDYERSGAPNDDDFPEFSTQELIYRPRWTRTTTPYGFPPTERVILRVNTALRKQTYDLGRFTDGNIPIGILSPPEGMMGPEQVAQFEDWWNAKISGDQAQRNRLHFLPWKAAYQELMSLSEGGRYESALDEWMLKITCAAFDVPPQELGFTADVNKATGEVQENALYRRCIIPLCTWLCRTIFNPIIQDAEYLNQPQLEARFDYGEGEDKKLAAEVQQGDVTAGIISADESRSMRYPELDGKAPGPPAQPQEVTTPDSQPPTLEPATATGRFLTTQDIARPKTAVAKQLTDDDVAALLDHFYAQDFPDDA